jgi:hypothetical protein
MTSQRGPSPQWYRRDSTRTRGSFIPSKRHYTATDLCGGKRSPTGAVKYSRRNRNGSQLRYLKSSLNTLVLGGVRGPVRDLCTPTTHEPSPRSPDDSLTRHINAGAASGRASDGGQGVGS